MPNKYTSICLSGLMLIISACLLTAQNDLPPSFDKRFSSFLPSQTVPVVSMPAIDWAAVRQEDERGPGTRFSKSMSADINPLASGEWTDLPNGDRVWRMAVRSQGALSLAVFFDQVNLPEGGRLYLYKTDNWQLFGPYTPEKMPAGKRTWLGLIDGDQAVLEYYEPQSARGMLPFHIYRIDHGYRRDEGGPRSPAFDFGTSLACHDNAVCAPGDRLPDQRRGICRIIIVVAEGMGRCTGNLMNNVRQDLTPYIYTGFHCMDGYTPEYDLWRFDFNYESAACPEPAVEPDYDSMMGSIYRAGRRENDFLLVELMNDVPSQYMTYYLGWNRDGVGPDTSYIFHHPRGDIKKIGASYQAATVYNSSINWDNGVTTPPQNHFNVIYSVGGFEVGSSGAALLNKTGKMVGHLHGGNPNLTDCTGSQAWFGRLSRAWDGGGTPATRLKDWLDPDNTGVMELNGTYFAGGSAGVGFLGTEDGDPITGAMIHFVAGNDTIVYPNYADGTFPLVNVPAGTHFKVWAEKDYNATNGVSTLDIIALRKHILGIQVITSPYIKIAADVNASGSVSTLDLIQVQKVILHINESFGSVPSWQFIPQGYQFTDPNQPFLDNWPTFIEGTNFPSVTDFDFIGIKSGDLNGSAHGDM